MYRDYMNTVYMKNRIYGYSINKKQDVVKTKKTLNVQISIIKSEFFLKKCILRKILS